MRVQGEAGKNGLGPQGPPTLQCAEGWMPRATSWPLTTMPRRRYKQLGYNRTGTV